ncbi:hypothetical protein FE257_009062 [Aspergillus nanangensis]|uniref:Uncharacterized protein n=1 Tax=Aspergillus nanangensis TaxID=2582783 RepID=A0AAD4GXQ7_ASPNN|nr:hypothetical protein FE257_009062 [Aspergillus nanangensis]
MSSPSPHDIKERLRRSHSTRTVRRGHRISAPLGSGPFDADAARYQATLAASLAMRCSTERSSLESRRSYDSLGGPSSMAVPQRTLRRGDYIIDAEAVPLHRSVPSHGESPSEDVSALVVLPPITEFGGLDGQAASLPSSYRRLRKTRSMFAPRQRLSRTLYGQSPVSSHYVESGQEHGYSSPRTRGTVRRSLSFLRGDRQASPSLQHARSQDAAIRLARAEFEQSHLKYYGQDAQPSPFTLKSGREHKTFRKTFRTTSASGVDAPNTPPSIERYRSISSFGRARSFSLSIKKGIKRVLGWPKIPVDPVQLETSPCHAHDQDLQSISYGQEAANSSEDSNPHKSPQLRDTTNSISSAVIRSIQSFESLASSSSRVTSWADSTAANTITALISGEQSHLPSIDENEDMHNNSRQYLAGSSHAGLPSTASPTRPRSTIDSQRLYTALMRKIGRSNIRGSDEDIIFGHVKEHCVIPTQPSSLRPRSSRQTVRQVHSNESIASLRSFATARAGTDTPQKPRSLFGRRRFVEDEETKGASVTQSQDLESSPDSHSVYSRTTSGNSPPRKVKEADLDHLGPDDEPGVATIFESQRTTYSSPKREMKATNGASIHPSIDWKQWVSSQMDRIEQVVPVRDHYREDAQIHTEDTGEPSDGLTSQRAMDHHDSHQEENQEIPFCCTPSSTEPLKSSRVLTDANFSRPLCRSSSVRAIVAPQREADDTAPMPLTRSSISPKPKNFSTPNTFSISRTRPRSNAIVSSPMQSKPANRLAAPESPTPKRSPGTSHLRLARYGNNSAKWSPSSVQESTALSLRSARASRDLSKWTNENTKNEYLQGDLKDMGGKSQVASPQMSSKRMVEIFLKSRRRQMESDASEGGVSGDAFI